MKNILHSGLLFITILFFACQKDPIISPIEKTCDFAKMGVFSATINNQPWNACQYKAIYYTHAKLLSVIAIDKDSKNELRFYITLDSLYPLKNYIIGPNRTTASEILEDITSDIVDGYDNYFCDFNKTGVGGSITISKLDVPTQKMSATFTTTGYSIKQKKLITVQEGIIDNIEMDTSGQVFSNGSYVSADINNVSWYGTDMFKKITLMSGLQNQFLELKIPGYYLEDYSFLTSWGHSYNDHAQRYLSFQLPLKLGTGTFQLYPQKEPFFYQLLNAEKHIFSYNLHNSDESFFPLTGTITITNIDMAGKNLDAIFSTQTIDTTGNTMNFTNGKIHIVKWEDF